MRLYHGTDVAFDKIDLTKSKPNKDFGQGFYLADNYEQALKLAEGKTRLLGQSPVVLTYEFDEALFDSSEFKVLRFGDYSVEWAEFVLANRRAKTQGLIHDYDIVIGPIADDRVGVQLYRFLQGDIDIETLVKRLKYMKGMTIQYFFSTQRVIDLLRRV
jgi:hypothetical protein